MSDLKTAIERAGADPAQVPGDAAKAPQPEGRDGDCQKKDGKTHKPGYESAVDKSMMSSSLQGYKVYMPASPSGPAAHGTITAHEQSRNLVDICWDATGNTMRTQLSLLKLMGAGLYVPDS